MSLINQESGDLAFSDGFCLRAGMPARELSERLFAMREGIACLPAHPAHGGSLAPVCQLENGGLHHARERTAGALSSSPRFI